MPTFFRRVLVVVVWSGMLALPMQAKAETSYHKLKKHLREGERIAGGVVDKTGEALAEVLSNVTIDIDLGSDNSKVATAKPPKSPAKRPPK
jgi:hypothetical protein